MLGIGRQNGHFGFKRYVEHLAIEHIGIGIKLGSTLTYYFLAQYRLTTGVTTYTQESCIDLLAEVLARWLTHNKSGLCLERNDIGIEVVTTCKFVYLLFGENNLLTRRNIYELICMLTCRRSCYAPISFEIL